MDYPVLAGCGLTRSDAAKVLPLVLLVCQRGCKRSTNPLQRCDDALSEHPMENPKGSDYMCKIHVRTYNGGAIFKKVEIYPEG